MRYKCVGERENAKKNTRVIQWQGEIKTSFKLHNLFSGGQKKISGVYLLHDQHGDTIKRFGCAFGYSIEYHPADELLCA